MSKEAKLFGASPSKDKTETSEERIEKLYRVKIDILEVKIGELAEAIRGLRKEMLKLQIVFPDGEPVRFPAGDKVEADLVGLLTDELCPHFMCIRTKRTLIRGIEKAVYKFKEQILKVPVRLNH